MTQSEDIVRVTIDDNVGTIILNDPDRKNAYSIEMKKGVLDALDSIDHHRVRCIVIEGAGDAFCAGGDIDRMERRLKEEHVPLTDVKTVLTLSNEIITRLTNHSLPVVTKIDGPAVGGGAALAVAGDIKLASERARIGFGFRNVGLSLDGGLSYHLPRIVGQDVAKELLLTGRMLDADEAESVGLIHRSFPLDTFDEQATEVISDIAAGPTLALGLIKQLINRSFDVPLETALDDEIFAQYVASNSHDHREGVRSFLNDREPEFTGT